jgi:DNA polymerase II
VKAFVIYPTYRVENNTAYVYLYGRQEDGKTFLTRNKCRPYFFIKATDEKAARKVFPQITISSSKKKTFDEEDLITVTMDSPKDVPDLRDTLHEEGITTYEADVRFTYRFMMDHGIQGSMEIQGNPTQHPFVDCYYEEPSFKPVEYVPKNLKILSIDIETGQLGKKLYCISLVGSDGYNRVLFVADEPVKGKNIDTFGTEKTCLEAFTAAVREYDPDIITGWSVIDFDLQQLQEFSQRNHVPFILGRSDEKVKLKVESGFLRESTADIVGRMVLDGIMLLKISFVKLEDYKLGTAAEAILGEEKIFTENKLQQIEDSYRKNKTLLAEYCRKDSELVLRILEKKQLIELTIQRSTLTGMQLDRVKGNIASLDSLYLRELDKRAIAAKTLVHQEKEQQITGAYVMTSKPGIYDYVIVCDFKSLYPSIMRSLNIDPLSYMPGKKLKKSTKEFVVAENGAVFKNTQGILPSLLEKLHAAREDARKKKNEVARAAIKVLMNSFFGALATPQSRFFNMEVANAITITGQSVIKRTMGIIEEMGYEIIYGDTDSIFIHTHVHSQEEANAIGKSIEKEINKFFTEWIPEHYHRESKLELNFDKVFVRFYMPKTRSGEGSKKRYAGMRLVDGKEKIDFTGLEFVRRDWTDLAKDFQLTVLDKIFHKQDVTQYVKDTIRDLKAGKLDNKLVYKKALRKDVAQYTKTTPPHVKAARLLGDVNKGIIEYVMTVKGPQPVEKIDAPIDYEHYIDKQLRPLADAVLTFYNTKFDDLVIGSSQKSLFQF